MLLPSPGLPVRYLEAEDLVVHLLQGEIATFLDASAYVAHQRTASSCIRIDDRELQAVRVRKQGEPGTIQGTKVNEGLVFGVLLRGKRYPGGDTRFRWPRPRNS